MRKNQTIWNPTVDAGVVIVDKLRTDEGVAWHTSKLRFLSDYSKEHSASVWVAMRTELQDVWHRQIAALLNQDVAYDDKQ